jgi:putative inorganic carbon (HCO3(-)) transporter
VKSKQLNAIYGLLGLLYVLLSAYFIWNKQEFLTLFPLGLLAIYFAFFYSRLTFLALAFFVPISINIEEWANGVGLFLPTEPILFGLMLLIILQQLSAQKVKFIGWQNLIILSISSFLLWVFFTSISSTHPLVSYKFLLAKLWYIIPIFFYGAQLFQDTKNIKVFIWLFIVGMLIAMLYTLINHASYSFAEKEGHWVMFPFFKDHTIYGALVAFVLPLVFSIYFSKKHTPLVQFVLFFIISVNLIALFFSYTRAAWLSVFAAVGVLFLIKLKIKFRLILLSTLTIGFILFVSWDQIQMSLAKNKSEHTTEDFGKRLESAANVTTDASNLERINRWNCAIDMFKERPFLGFGPGTYAFEYARFQEPENLTIISTNFGDMGNAHSEYLSTLAEMGVFGLLTFLFFVVALFYKGITLYLKWDANDTETRTLLLGMIMALTTYFVHGFLNNYLDTDKAAFPIFGFAAAFIALEYKLKKSTK